MIVSIIDEAKQRLQRDFASPTDEWDYLLSLISQSESDKIPLLKWVFEESPAYWDTRANAGIILLKEEELETWQTIVKLVESSNPDDNGTALTLFETTGDPRGLELAQYWLNDTVHPATQIEATVFLKDIVPDKVKACLQTLINHENNDIQHSARRLFDELFG